MQGHVQRYVGQWVSALSTISFYILSSLTASCWLAAVPQPDWIMWPGVSKKMPVTCQNLEGKKKGKRKIFIVADNDFICKSPFHPLLLNLTKTMCLTSLMGLTYGFSWGTWGYEIKAVSHFSFLSGAYPPKENWIYSLKKQNYILWILRCSLRIFFGCFMVAREAGHNIWPIVSDPGGRRQCWAVEALTLVASSAI